VFKVVISFLKVVTLVVIN